MISRRRALIVPGLAISSLIAAEALKPRRKLATSRAIKMDLGSIIPTKFGQWQSVERAAGGIVNPSVEENIRRIYTQTLSRTYINDNGTQIMISIAYGEDQRKSLSLHYPEVCYPAQGFKVRSNITTTVSMPGIELPIRRLETYFGSSRFEPVTYWTTIGDYTAFNLMPRRLIELRYGLNRLIPDGLLFRVSSIGRDSEEQFILQEKFIREILTSIKPQVRELLTGKVEV